MGAVCHTCDGQGEDEGDISRAGVFACVYFTFCCTGVRESRSALIVQGAMNPTDPRAALPRSPRPVTRQWQRAACRI